MTCLSYVSLMICGPNAGQDPVAPSDHSQDVVRREQEQAVRKEVWGAARVPSSLAGMGSFYALIRNFLDSIEPPGHDKLLLSRIFQYRKCNMAVLGACMLVTVWKEQQVQRVINERYGSGSKFVLYACYNQACSRPLFLFAPSSTRG